MTRVSPTHATHGSSSGFGSGFGTCAAAAAAVVVTLFVSTLCAAPHVSALSSSTGDVKIVGMPGGTTQTLPGTYVRSFDRWYVDTSIGPSSSSLMTTMSEHRPTATWIDVDANGETEDVPPGDESRLPPPPPPPPAMTLERLRTSGDDTYVDPTSTSDLWWPSDLRLIQIRPALDVLIKGGVPHYALAGLNVRVPGGSSVDGAEWRNYGLNSQPMARQWTTFGFAVEQGFRVECFVEHKRGKRAAGEKDGRVPKGEADHGDEDDERGGGEGQGEEKQWTRLFPGHLGSLNDSPAAHALFGADRMRRALENVGMFLSEIDDASPLSDGFHVVSFPLTEIWIDLPRPSSVAQDESGGGGGAGGGDTYKLVCVATAEPDAEALLGMDGGLVEMTATSVLKVDVSQTSAGGESNYLPESYRPLYVSEG